MYEFKLYDVVIRIAKKVNTLEVCIAAVYNSLVKFGHQVPPLMGDARYKTLNEKLSHFGVISSHIGSILAGSFVWNRICTAFNPGGWYWVGIELRSSQQFRKNIIHQYRPSIQTINLSNIHQSINQPINIHQYCSDGIELRFVPLPWKYFPPISAICSFKPKITAIRIENWNLDWIEKQGASRLPLSPDRSFKGKDPKTTATELSKIVLGGFFLLNKTLMPIVQHLPATLYKNDLVFIL